MTKSLFPAHTKTMSFDSTFIKKISYDEFNNVLHVFIKDNKKLYSFLNVPLHVFLTLMDSKSKGSYFNKKIKNKFRIIKSIINDL